LAEVLVRPVRLQEVLDVMIVAIGTARRDAPSVESFSWSELPELLAADDLFSAAAGIDVFARGDEDDDEFEDEDEDEDEEDD